MPIFRDKNLLFIHIPKNAGRSVERLLFLKGLSSQSGKRGITNRFAHWLQSRTANPIAQEYICGTVDASLAGSHMTLSEIDLLGFIGRSEIDRLFKFCVVRNPYERAVSSILHFEKRFRAEYQLDSPPNPQQVERALAFWIAHEGADHNVRAHRRPQVDYIRRCSQANAMDMTLRFETLAADLEALKQHLELDLPSLPWVGKSRQAHHSYASLYTSGARKMVAKAFAEDLDLFRYSFPK